MGYGGTDKYYDPTDKIVYTAEVAEANDLNSINESTDAAFGLVADDLDALALRVGESETRSEAWAEDPLGSNPDPLQPTKYSSKANSEVAKSWATGVPIDADGVVTGDRSARVEALAAAESANQAADSLAATNQDVLDTAANLVATNQDVLDTAANLVATNQDTIDTAADLVLTNADVVLTGINVGLTNADVAKANEWAEKAEDVPVETGQYSALHWSAKAEAFATAIGNTVVTVTGTTDRVTVDDTDPANPIIDISPNFSIARAARKNLLINGAFNVYQRTEDLILTANQYGPDRWQAGDAGCTYTITTSGRGNIIEITAGSLRQKIEDVNVPDGSTVLSWIGTSQGRVDAGTYGLSGEVTAILVAGVQAEVEFDVGTVSQVQLEVGSEVTDFEYRSYGEELALCQRYYWRGKASGTFGWNSLSSETTSAVGPTVRFNEMRTTPTVNIVDAPSYRDCTSGGISGISRWGFAERLVVSADILYRAFDGIYEADAEL